MLSLGEATNGRKRGVIDDITTLTGKKLYLVDQIRIGSWLRRSILWGYGEKTTNVM